MKFLNKILGAGFSSFLALGLFLVLGTSSAMAQASRAGQTVTIPGGIGPLISIAVQNSQGWNLTNAIGMTNLLTSPQIQGVTGSQPSGLIVSNTTTAVGLSIGYPVVYNGVTLTVSASVTLQVGYVLSMTSDGYLVINYAISSVEGVITGNIVTNINLCGLPGAPSAPGKPNTGTPSSNPTTPGTGSATNGTYIPILQFNNNPAPQFNQNLAVNQFTGDTNIGIVEVGPLTDVSDGGSIIAGKVMTIDHVD